MDKLFFALVVVLAFAMSSCTNRIDGDKTEKAMKFCDRHGGLMYIQNEVKTSLDYIKCNDKSTIKIKDLD